MTAAETHRKWFLGKPAPENKRIELHQRNNRSSNRSSRAWSRGPILVNSTRIPSPDAVFRTTPIAATLLGMLTGTGGGMVRDVLVMEVPTVLRAELSAVAALLGAAFTVGGQSLGLPFARGGA